MKKYIKNLISRILNRREEPVIKLYDLKDVGFFVEKSGLTIEESICFIRRLHGADLSLKTVNALIKMGMKLDFIKPKEENNELL